VRDDTFMLTYGEGVADVDIARLLEGNRASKTALGDSSVRLRG
jgi:hypothetical protein